MITFLAGIIIFGIIILGLMARFGPRRAPRLKQEYFQHQWMEFLARVKTT
jgi:hypothetical protein